MGEIVGAALLAHAPTIMLSQEDRYELNEGKEISLVPGLHRFRSEVMDAIRPDTVIVLDSHWFTTVEFCVSGQEHRTGLFTSDELPRGMSQVPYDLKGNPALAGAIAERATACGVRTNAIADPCLPIHYPTVNLAHYLHAGEEWLSVSCADRRNARFPCRRPGHRPGHRRVGPPRAAAGQRIDEPPLLAAVRTPSPRGLGPDPHQPPGSARGRSRTAGMVLQGRSRLGHRHHARIPQARARSALWPLPDDGGRLSAARMDLAGRALFDYENATGTSQVHVWFARP
jgi:hypothetical protein